MSPGAQLLSVSVNRQSYYLFGFEPHRIRAYIRRPAGPA
jgi:hypothetical protein